jgi:enoyl-CoA hydratase/carnithine racemase
MDGSEGRPGMSLIGLARHDRVAVLELSRGVTHPLDLALLEDLSDRLATLASDASVAALVLTGAGEKFFSIGFDLPALVPLDRESFAVFFRAFNRVTMELFSFPAPTVAAVRGHAVAGGCILALACDRRVIAEERTLMGLNEIRLGVPIPLPGDCILRSTVSPGVARTIVESGEFHESARLLEMGLVDGIVPRERVLERAVAVAAEHGAFPRDVARAIKRSRTARVDLEVAAGREAHERAFLEAWFSADARARLADAAERF